MAPPTLHPPTSPVPITSTPPVAYKQRSVVPRARSSVRAGGAVHLTAEPVDREFLEAWLRGRDVLCPVCAYNLRDLRDMKCPECAAPLRLQIASPNLEIAAWAAAAISLSLAIGFDLVASVLAAASLVVFVLPPGVFWNTLALMGYLLGAAAICGLGLGVLFFRRRAWARLALRVQWVVATGIFVTVGVGHAVLGVFLLRLL